MAETHEVMVLCRCPNVEMCSMELYVSDVRVAHAEIEFLTAMLEAALEVADG